MRGKLYSFSQFKQAKDDFEREFILKALKVTNNSITKTAKLLNMERRTLQNRINRLNISLSFF